MTDKPESETTAGLSAVPELPVVAWESWNKYTGDCWGPITPHAPAQAIIDAQAAEIERLKLLVLQSEEGRKEAAHAEAYYRQAEMMLTTNERELHAQLAALKAKQAADIDETMRLASAMSLADVCCVLTAETKAYHENYRIKDAARKALRSHLAKDRT